MPEKGARPHVPALQRRILRALGTLSTPLLPDDYLELINPLWSTRELRGRVEVIRPETPDAATVVIKPGYRWRGHKPGQYLRIGLDIRGSRHWRAYSLTSDPDRRDGRISITVKNVDEGQVSPYLVRHGRPGTLVALGGVEGDFVLPDEFPDRLLFVSAGSGITPIMSMLRHLAASDALKDVVLVHSARTREEVIFGRQLRSLSEQHEGFRLHERHTAAEGRITPAELGELCPDWAEREAFVSGPAGMLDAVIEHWERAGRHRAAAPRALPAQDRRRRGGRGRRDQVPQERPRDRVGRPHADSRCRRASGARAALRLPRGHLPHLRGGAALRARAGSAQRKRVRPGR